MCVVLFVHRRTAAQRPSCEHEDVQLQHISNQINASACKNTVCLFNLYPNTVCKPAAIHQCKYKYILTTHFTQQQLHVR